MRFSAFNGFGLAQFSGAEPMAETVYRALNSASGGGTAFDVSTGTEMDATNFCDAIGIASARRSLERAKLNLAPETATEKLPQHEAAYVVVPPVGATVAQRRALVAAKNLAARGSRHEAIVSALQAAFGSEFVDLYVVPLADVERWPATVGDAPGLYSRVDIPAKTLRLLDVVAPDFAVSGVVTVPYENWDTSQADELATVNDRLLVECEVPGGAEVVTVTAVSGTGSTRTLTATFTKPHPIGCSATTRSTPLQMSTRRHMLVILKVEAARDLEKRRLANEIMASTVRGVTTWNVVHPYTNFYDGFLPFQLDVSALDTTPLDTFTW